MVPWTRTHCMGALGRAACSSGLAGLNSQRRGEVTECTGLPRKKAQSKAGVTGVQNARPPDVPLGHVDYFVLKTIKAQTTQEETLTFP